MHIDIRILLQIVPNVYGVIFLFKTTQEPERKTAGIHLHVVLDKSKRRILNYRLNSTPRKTSWVCPYIIITGKVDVCQPIQLRAKTRSVDGTKHAITVLVISLNDIGNVLRVKTGFAARNRQPCVRMLQQNLLQRLNLCVKIIISRHRVLSFQAEGAVKRTLLCCNHLDIDAVIERASERSFGSPVCQPILQVVAHFSSNFLVGRYVWNVVHFTAHRHPSFYSLWCPRLCHTLRPKPKFAGTSPMLCVYVILASDKDDVPTFLITSLSYTSLAV